MKNAIFILILIFFFSNLTFGQKEFTVTDGSKNYFAMISVNKFINNDCSGEGTVSLYDKSTNVLVQSFKSDNLCFYIEGNSNPSVNIIELYGEQSPLIFDDFNFDGYEDLAINNGNNGSYGGPSYDVYLFTTATNRFLKNAKLTEIASANLGMFLTDKIRKRLVTFNKSGCCWHIKTEYEMNGKDLLKVYELEEDATNGSEYVTVTERKLVNGAWNTDIKKYKTEEYYNYK